MCRFFEVLRSGYYGYVARMNIPAKDIDLANKIQECQEKCGKTYGYRRVHIWLERQGVHHNPKTILCVMQKYNLLSVVRELQLHSDQGFQYTSQAYYRLTKSYNITPSMSRKGNPYDNALAENFFSILKTECVYRIKLKTYDEALLIIDEYIHFYNNERIQLKTKLTPQEMRCQYIA